MIILDNLGVAQSHNGNICSYNYNIWKSVFFVSYIFAKSWAEKIANRTLPFGVHGYKKVYLWEYRAFDDNNGLLLICFLVCKMMDVAQEHGIDK